MRFSFDSGAPFANQARGSRETVETVEACCGERGTQLKLGVNETG